PPAVAAPAPSQPPAAPVPPDTGLTVQTLVGLNPPLTNPLPPALGTAAPPPVQPPVQPPSSPPAGDTGTPATGTAPDLAPPPLAITAVSPARNPFPGSYATNTAAPTVSGTGPAGATVTLTVDGSAAGQTTAGANGSWAVGLAALADGGHNLSATGTAGGRSLL